MATDEIEISSRGIRISYLRFLSDTAAGFILVTYFIILYSNIENPNIKAAIPFGTIELRIFLLAVAFLLATPIGIAINAVSWFLIGWVTDYVHNRFVNAVINLDETIYDARDVRRRLKVRYLRVWFPVRRWLTARLLIPTTTEMQLDIWRDKFFGIRTVKEWANTAAQLENVLEHYYPNVVRSLGYLQGLQIFFRNLAFLTLIAPWPTIWIWDGFLLPLGIIVPTLVFLYIVMTGFVSFYQQSGTLHTAYTLCLRGRASNMESMSGNLILIREYLVRMAAR